MEQDLESEKLSARREDSKKESDDSQRDQNSRERSREVASPTKMSIPVNEQTAKHEENHLPESCDRQITSQSRLEATRGRSSERNRLEPDSADRQQDGTRLRPTLRERSLERRSANDLSLHRQRPPRDSSMETRCDFQAKDESDRLKTLREKVHESRLKKKENPSRRTTDQGRNDRPGTVVRTRDLNTNGSDEVANDPSSRVSRPGNGRAASPVLPMKRSSTSSDRTPSTREEKRRKVEEGEIESNSRKISMSESVSE